MINFAVALILRAVQMNLAKLLGEYDDSFRGCANDATQHKTSIPSGYFILVWRRCPIAASVVNKSLAHNLTLLNRTLLARAKCFFCMNT